MLKVLGYVGMTVMAGLLAQTMVTTYYLGKIDKGLTVSLDSTTQLISIQKAIVEKNESLKDVVSTTQAMDQQLQLTLKATQGIRANILRINELNGATLQLNQHMMTSGTASNQSLDSIYTGMTQLKQSTEELYASLDRLNGITQQDRSNLQQMKAYTEQMNRKIPGVTR
jgi:methyl-accepting chemotaxis protein